MVVVLMTPLLVISLGWTISLETQKFITMKDDQKYTRLACAECHTTRQNFRKTKLRSPYGGLLMMLKCVYIAEMNFSLTLKVNKLIVGPKY